MEVMKKLDRRRMYRVSRKVKLYGDDVFFLCTTLEKHGYEQCK